MPGKHNNKQDVAPAAAAEQTALPLWLHLIYAAKIY